MKLFKKLIVLIIISILGCGDNDNFPNTNVNINIPITMPEYYNVYNNPWGYEFLSGGLGGIIIVNNGFTEGEFLAYDRACTFEINSDCIVTGEYQNDQLLKCSCCDSQFVTTDGGVTEGPANQALKKYHTYFDGSILYITN